MSTPKTDETPVQKGWKSLENLWIDSLQRAVSHPGLLGLQGKLFSALVLPARQWSEANAEGWLRLWGLPSAAQQREALGLLQRLEDRLLRLEDRVEELAAARDGRPEGER